MALKLGIVQAWRRWNCKLPKGYQNSALADCDIELAGEVSWRKLLRDSVLFHVVHAIGTHVSHAPAIVHHTNHDLGSGSADDQSDVDSWAKMRLGQAALYIRLHLVPTWTEAT